MEKDFADILGPEQTSESNQQDQFDDLLGKSELAKQEQQGIVGSLLSSALDAAGAIVSPTFYKGLAKGVYYAPEALEALARKNYETFIGDTIESFEPTKGQERIQYLEEKIKEATPKTEEGKWEKMGMEVARTLSENLPSIGLSVITPGGVAAKTAVGITSSAVPAGAASRYDFLQDQRNFLRDAIKNGDIENFGQEDWDKLRVKYAELADYYGAAEAIPSALGGVIQFPLLVAGKFAIPFMKPISGAIDSLTSKYGAEAATTAVKQALTSKAVQSALKVSAASGTELSEEVVTELLQSAIEASPEIMKRESGKSIAEAITDVGAVSLLAGGGPQVLREGYTAIRGTPQEKAKAEQEQPQTQPQATPEATTPEAVVATPDQKPSEKIRDILAKMSPEEARQKKTEIAANEGIVITEDLDIDESDEAVLQTYIDQYEADNQVDLDAELALLAEQETQSEESDIETESLATTITDIQEAPETDEEVETEQIQPEPEVPIEKDVEEISQSILDSVSQEDLGDDYAIVSDAVANVVNAANTSTEALDQEIDNVEAIAREYIDVAQNPESTPESSAKAAIAAEALLNIASVREAMPIVREAVPSAQDTLATGTKTSEQITQTSEVAPQKDAVQSGLWRIKRGATESNRPIDFYLEVQTADETFEKMNLEMTPNEYDSLIASGGQLRSYSLFDTSTIAKMLADLDRKYLKAIGLPADLTNEPLTELEVISLFFQKYLDQYNNNLAYVVNKTKMPYAGTPIILKSLGERIADVYSRMNDEQKRTVDEGLYTELQYIEDFMPTLKPAYEQMMALSYDDSFFSDKTDTEVADIANSSGDAPLVFRAEIELNKRANAPKYNYPTTRAMGLEPKSVFIENDSQDIDVASLSFRGIKFFSQIGIISDGKKKPKFKGQSGVNDGFVVFDGVTSKTKANKMAREILMESTYVPEFSAFYHEMPVSEFLRMNQNDPEISSQDIEMLESSKDGVVRVLLQREGSKKTAPSFILKTDEFSGVTSTGKKTTYARLSFSTKNPSTVPMQTVQEQVMQLQQNAEVGGVIKVVQNISDLPKSVLSSLPQIPPGKTLKGVTDENGDIYIIAQSMTSVKDAYRTIVHELSHKGIINMINKVGRGTSAYDALMANIMQMMTPYEADLDLIASDYGYDLNDKEQRLNAIFEWLSYRSERVAPSRYRRFKAALNRFLRAIFGRTLFDGNDIDMLIDRIRDQVKVGNKFYSIAISTPDAPVKMPEAAEAVYQKSQKAPQDYMTAVEKAIDGTFKWLGKIVDPGSWLSQFGIDTRKKDAFGNEYGIADDLLRRMTESNRVGQTYAKYVMKQILEPLGSDKSRYDLFSRYIYARDLQKDIELGLVSEFGEDTRHGFKSEQEFSEYFDLLDAEVKNSMDILAAVSRRDDEILNIFDELKSLKLIPAETLRDPRYFHHAVLKYMDAKTGGVFGRAAKRVKGGEAKGRTGTESSADIYFTSYIEAEGEYIADAISRIHFNIDLNRIGSVYNVKKKLTDMANAKNIKDVSKIEADLIRKADPDISEEDFVEKLNQMPLAQFRKSILILSNKMVESSSIDLAFALYSMDKSTRSSISFEDFYKIVDDIVYRINSALPAVGAYAEENNIKINSKADAIKVVADLMAEEQTFQNDLVMRFFTGEINLVQMASSVVRNPESIHHKQILKTSLGLLGSISKRKKYIKDTLGDRFRTYRTILSNAKNNVIIKGDKADPFDIAMSEYTEYNPSQSLNMYYTNTADEFNLNMLALEGKTSIDVDKLKKALAISAPNNWVIPQDLSDAMTNFKPYDRAGIPDAGAGRVLYQVNALSRYLILFSPEKFINYFTNNALSDFGKAAIFFPKAVADRARNMRCLKTSINMADGQYNELAKLATFLRVVDTGVYMRDIDSIRKAFNNDEYLFHFLNKTEPKENADKYISKVSEVVGGLFSKYTNAVTTINQVRENFQRLVVFDYVLSEAEKGNYVEGVTPDYMRGAVKKLGDAPYAARIARDAIGDYGNLSLNGLAMRNTLIFFYGFMETNFTAYYNYFRNAAIRSLPEGFNGNFASRKDQMEWLVKASAVITAQGALAALPATMLIAAAFAMFPEETEEIMQTAEEDKGPIRIPIGKKDPKTGYIPTVGYSDTFFDFLSWIGIENPYKVGAVISGKKSATDVAIEAPINGIKKAIGSFTGTLNVAGVIAGQSYFPDIFNPRPIERDVAVANMLGLGGSYKWLAGHPKTGTGEYLSMLPTVRYVSPGEANYRYTQGLVDKIRQKKGLSTSRMDIERSPKDYAKYMYRKSVQYGDAKSAQHWLEEFQELGGNRSSLRYDLQATDPLNGLNGTGVSKSKFMSELTPAQRKSVVDGIAWWKNFYGKLR